MDRLDRRAILMSGMAALSLATLPAYTEAAGRPFGKGPFSGLPWHSGCSLENIDTFGTYRGRPLDGYTIWCPHRSWADITSLKGGFTVVKKLPGRISMAIAPLPATHSATKNPSNYNLAAKGSFDSYYTQFAQKLAESGVKNAIVRIGWESNDTPRPWYGGSNPRGFRDTFKRISDILRRYNPTVSIEWNNLKKGSQSGSVLEMYPGDSYVDIIGVNYYDNWPALNTEEIWNRQYNAMYRGGPWGIGAWLDFAKSRGKKFSCSEWGISVGTSPGTKDNPLYIRKMHELFRNNASYIAYENYFNQKLKHQIYPANIHPLASSMYRRLWGNS